MPISVSVTKTVVNSIVPLGTLGISGVSESTPATLKILPFTAITKISKRWSVANGTGIVMGVKFEPRPPPSKTVQPTENVIVSSISFMVAVPACTNPSLILLNVGLFFM